jgi:hypothetical protein
MQLHTRREKEESFARMHELRTLAYLQASSLMAIGAFTWGLSCL